MRSNKITKTGGKIKMVSPMHFNIRVSFVILETHIEFWAVLLDQVHLQDQSLKLGTNHDPIYVNDTADHLARFVILHGAGVVIRTQSIAQINRLTNVDYLAISSLH